MDTVSIETRIATCEEVIEKKKALIEKRLNSVEKIYSKIGKDCGMNGEFVRTSEFAGQFYDAVGTTWKARVSEIQEKYSTSDRYYEILTEGKWEDIEDAYYKLYDYVESIRNSQTAISEREVQIAKYKEKLEQAYEKERFFETLPKIIVDFMDSVVESWDLWDKMKRESVKEAQKRHQRYYDEARPCYFTDRARYDAMMKEARELQERYSVFEWYELPCLDDQQIHDRNVKAGKALVMDLYNRICLITKDIEDASNLKVTRGNENFAVINGIVKGTNGKTAKVQSVGAGGWNIQRFHIRTLVNEVRA